LPSAAFLKFGNGRGGKLKCRRHTELEQKVSGTKYKFNDIIHLHRSEKFERKSLKTGSASGRYVTERQTLRLTAIINFLNNTGRSISTNLGIRRNLSRIKPQGNYGIATASHTFSHQSLDCTVS
jgi:hypothetical protein